jgi:hypothetical protein
MPRFDDGELPVHRLPVGLKVNFILRCEALRYQAPRGNPARFQASQDGHLMGWSDRFNKHMGLRSMRTWIAILVASTIAGFIPEFWGADLLSLWGVLFSGLGAFVGLWWAIRTD